MATEQQVIDVKYDIIKAEQEQKLREIFDPTILSWLYKNNVNTLEDAFNFTGFFDITNFNKTFLSLKGIEYLKGTEGIYLRGNTFTGVDLDLSQNINIEYLYCEYTGLTSIGNIGFLSKLKSIFLTNNSSIGYFGSIANNINLIDFYVSGIGLTQIDVDRYLSQCKTAYDAGAPFTGGINLSSNAIPTGGATNPDYVYLTNEGITVTIDV